MPPSRIDAIATSGTTGVGIRNSIGTNASIVGYVAPPATGNRTCSTARYMTTTSARFDAEIEPCHGASTASSEAASRKPAAAAIWVISSRRCSRRWVLRCLPIASNASASGVL